MHKSVSVAYLGAKYSFHFQAAVAFFGSDALYRGKQSFDELSNAVTSGECRYGIIAIENNLAGIVSSDGKSNLRRIADNTLYIVAETTYYIHLCLGANPGVKLTEITTVYTHPFAWMEASAFFAKHPNIKHVATGSTADGIEKVASERLYYAGAIGSKNAIQEYKLNMLAENIENETDNYTRFFIISASKTLDQDTTLHLPKASLILPVDMMSYATHIAGEHNAMWECKQQWAINIEGMLYAEISAKSIHDLDNINFILQRKSKNVRILGVYESEAKP